MTTTPQLLIGLTGRAGAGKDSAAAALLAPPMRWAGLAFADALRVELASAFAVPIDTFTARHGKDRPNPRLAVCYATDPHWLHWCATHEHSLTAPRSPRWLMQQWGSWRRADDAAHWVHYADLWVRTNRAGPAGLSMVITDVRMPNEAAWLRAVGGRLVRVHRPDLPPLPADTAAHESEGHAALQADADIVNDGSLDHLHAQMLALAMRWLDVAAATEVSA